MLNDTIEQDRAEQKKAQKKADKDLVERTKRLTVRDRTESDQAVAQVQPRGEGWSDSDGSEMGTPKQDVSSAYDSSEEKPDQPSTRQTWLRATATRRAAMRSKSSNFASASHISH